MLWVPVWVDLIVNYQIQRIFTLFLEINWHL
jgi:hypothetical protein